MKITISNLVEGSIQKSIEALASESDSVASGVVGPAFSTSGPGSGWSVDHDVNDFAIRALADGYGAGSYVDSSDGREATLDQKGDVEWSEESVVEIEIPNAEEARENPDDARALCVQGPHYGADADECKKILAILDLIAAVEDGESDEAIDAANRLIETGATLNHDIDTDESWDEDDDGDPTCRVVSELRLIVEGHQILEGERIGFYSFCRSGGDPYTEWQDGDGPDTDQNWTIIAEVLTEVCGVDEEALEPSAPNEPNEPEPSENGTYRLIYHGWQQPWVVRARYEDSKDAARAARIADTKTQDVNGPSAYGWEYAVAEPTDDAEEADLFDGDQPLVILQDEERY